ncbi:MAG: YdcF family protein [Acidimicrobiia bacterium]
MNWRIVRRAVGLVALVGLGYLAVTFVQVWRAARRDDAQPSEAIVVLGAAQFDGRPSAVFRARLEHAADLFEADIAPVVVVTGGKQEGDRFTEATAGANYLHSQGVPDTAILRETQGESSWESLAASAQILEDRGMTDVVLVSDPFHSLRVEEIAEELGLDAVTSPSRGSPIDGVDEWKNFGTETLRVAAGRLIGFDRLARSSEVGKLVPGVGILG